MHSTLQAVLHFSLSQARLVGTSPFWEHLYSLLQCLQLKIGNSMNNVGQIINDLEVKN